MNHSEQRGRTCFEAFKKEQGYIADWDRLTVQTRLHWQAAAQAIFDLTNCHFDREVQKTANSHAPKNTRKK